MTLLHKAKSAQPGLSVLALLCFITLLQQGTAGEVRLAVDTDNVLNPIDVNIYGHFLEHIYHSANGGLWGELIWDRSFEGNGAALWRKEGETLIQDGTKPEVHLPVVEFNVKDFEFQFEARKDGGEQGFLVFLREQGKTEYFRADLGAGAGMAYSLERLVKGQKRPQSVFKAAGPQIGIDKWHTVRVRCEGSRIRVWLDEHQVIDYTDDGAGSANGHLSIGTLASQARFKNFKLTTLDGKVLYQGTPSPPKLAAPMPAWQSMGQGKTVRCAENAFNGHYCLEIEATGEMTGVIQSPLSLRAGEVYNGSLWARGDAPAGMVVRLMDHDTILAEVALPKPDAEWKEYPFSFNPAVSTANAGIYIAVKGRGIVWLDQVSMMPESWKQNGGFRPDLLKAIADLRPPIIRWPGGAFAQQYRWKDGIGPQSKRICYPVPLWDDVDVNSFGTDEFMALCRKVGAEPVLVINAGCRDKTAGQPDHLQDACDWVEYCNGPADSKWGSVRARNGHPEPYRVKYWELDNEVWSVGVDKYSDIVHNFAKAMKKIDPEIKLIVCGGGLINATYNNWNPRIMTNCGGLCDYLSIHKYDLPGRFAEAPLQFEANVGEVRETIAHSENPQVKLFVSEWNAQSTDLRAGLYAAGMLNGFERCGAIIAMASPALLMRHLSASDNNNAFINFDQSTWFAGGNYVVMKLWRENFAPLRVAVSGDAGSLNVVATKSEDGTFCVFKAMNPSPEKVEVTLSLPSSFDPMKAEMRSVIAPTPEASNTLEHPNVIEVVPGDVKVTDRTVHFVLPPLSASVIKVFRK